MSFSAEEFDNHRFEKVVSVNSDLKRKVFVRCIFDHCDLTKSDF